MGWFSVDWCGNQTSWVADGIYEGQVKVQSGMLVAVGEFDEAPKPPHHHHHEPQGLFVPIACFRKGTPMSTLSNAPISITANVGDVYTFGPGIGEDNASGTLVPGPLPATVSPYLAGPLQATVSDPTAVALITGTVADTFVATVLAPSSLPAPLSLILSDGATSQEFDFVIAPAPVLAPGATGLSVPFVKTSGP